MTMQEISKEYGAALFMLASEEEKTEEYQAALDVVVQAFSDNPEYISLLATPAIALSERLDIIEQAFSGRIIEDVVSYLKLLCEKGRIIHFNDSVLEYKSLLEESKRIKNAKITSAVELTAEERDKLKNKLETMSRSTVNIEYYIDESLLGGVIAEFDGKVLDSSLKTRLRDIKEVISE